MTGESVLRFVTYVGCFLGIYVTSAVYCEAWGESITIKYNASLSIEYIKYSTPMNWRDAVKQCGQAQFSATRQHLLCFESRNQIQDLFPQLGDLRIWLGQRNCYRMVTEECLSLNFTSSAIQDRDRWKFEFRCDRKLEFICRKFIHISRNDVGPEVLCEIKKQQHLEPVIPIISSASLQSGVKSSLLSCPRTQSRKISWPESPGEATVSQKCPQGMKGYAHWKCNGSLGEWGPEKPDLSECRSVALTQVMQKVSDHLDKGSHVTFYSARLISRVNLTETARDLLQMISNVDTGGAVIQAVDILDKLDDVFLSQAPAMTPAARRTLALGTSRHVLDTCDQLLTKSDGWNDLREGERYLTATKFLNAVDETGKVIASTMQKPGTEDVPAKNLVLEVVKLQEGSSQQNVTFRDEGSSRRPASRNSVTLPLGSDVKHAIFVLYTDLADILPSSQMINDKMRTLSSAVMSANISQGTLRGKAVVVLEHKGLGEWHDTFEPVCVWWDTRRQQWNPEGCTLSQTSAEQSICLCSHLTNFAVLVDTSCASCELDVVHRVALAVITIVGCSISIFCLSVCIVLFSFYRSLWGMRIMIHRNLCICLLVAQVLLLGGLDRTENKTVCGIIAGLLQYFFLAAFCWMFLEAFHIMWLLVKVFTPKQSHGIKFYIFGYGCPALIVIISAACNPKGYGTPRYCWLSTEDGTIWSYVVPVLVIIIFNTVTLGYALFTTHRILKNKEKVQLEGLKMWVRGATVLMPLLGVTWLVGFFFIDENTVIFAYIFAALNSLQGLGIFLFHCLLNKNVKERVFRSLQRSSIRKSTGTVRSSTRNTNSNKSSPGKGSSSPKRSSKFFVTQSHSDIIRDPSLSSPEELNGDEEQRVRFLQPGQNGGQSRVNTDDLYPLEVEK